MGRPRRRLRGDGGGPGGRLGLNDDPEVLARYLEEIARHPPLEPDEEIRLGRLAREGDVGAGEQLVQANLQLVVAIARRYAATGWPLLDLVQEGNLGLMQAVDGFDPDRGFPFRTYAMWWIRQAIASAIERHGDAPPAPSDRLQEVWDSLVSDLGRQPTIAELAEGLGVSEDRVRQLLGAPPA